MVYNPCKFEKIRLKIVENGKFSKKIRILDIFEAVEGVGVRWGAKIFTSEFLDHKDQLPLKSSEIWAGGRFTYLTRLRSLKIFQKLKIFQS